MQALSSAQWSRRGKFAKKRRMSGPESTEEIGKRLKWTREALGYSQAAISREISTDPNFAQVWNNWERGRDRISVDNALTLCAKFKLSLDWIYRGEDGLLPAKLVRAIEEAKSKPGKALKQA